MKTLPVVLLVSRGDNTCYMARWDGAGWVEGWIDGPKSMTPTFGSDGEAYYPYSNNDLSEIRLARSPLSLSYHDRYYETLIDENANIPTHLEGYRGRFWYQPSVVWSGGAPFLVGAGGYSFENGPSQIERQVMYVIGSSSVVVDAAKQEQYQGVWGVGVEFEDGTFGAFAWGEQS